MSDPLREALKTARDYVADTAAGGLVSLFSTREANAAIRVQAARDLASIEAALSAQVPEDELIERCAKAIEGPHCPVPPDIPYTLEELREVRWEACSDQERAVRRTQARAVLEAADRIEALGSPVRS